MPSRAGSADRREDGHHPDEERPGDRDAAPLRVLELRSVTGQGGGPDKTMVEGAALADPRRLRVTLCFLTRPRLEPLRVARRAAERGLDCVEFEERHLFDLRSFAAVRRLARQRDVSIVHSHDHRSDIFAWLLGRCERVAPMSTAHGWTGASWRERRIYYPIDRRVLAAMPRVIAVSGEIRDRLVRAGARPERIVVLLNGIAAEAGSTDPAAGAAARRAARAAWGVRAGDDGGAEVFVIGAVGRLARQKRIDLLLEAFAALRRGAVAGPGDRGPLLVVAGDGPERGALESRARALGVAGACRFLGHRGDIERLLPGFDVLVQASDYEGSSNAVLEAMAAGTPVVATAVGGTADLVRPDLDGLLVAPGDAAALAAGIERVVADPVGARARAASARRRTLEDLSFAARQRHLLTIYRDLARECGRPARASRPAAPLRAAPPEP